MEFRRTLITGAFACFALVANLWAAAPERGYIDRDYPVAKLNGKRIFVAGLSRANTDVSGLKARDGKSPLDSATADSLLLRFNAGLVKRLGARLSKARVQSGSVPLPSMTLTKSYGDQRIPDSISFQVPEPEGFSRSGFQGEISILLGRTVFGTRSVLVDRLGISGHWRNGFPGQTGHWSSGYDPRIFSLPPKDDGEIDTSYNVEKKKAFFSIMEFCFYDHATKQAFGYGLAAEETIYRRRLVEFLAGGKMDAGMHIEKMARSLTDLLLRSEHDLLKKYAKTELAPPAKPAVVKDEPREVLDLEED